MKRKRYLVKNAERRRHKNIQAKNICVNKAIAKRLSVLSTLKKRKRSQDFMQIFYIIKAKMKHLSKDEYCVLLKQKQNVYYLFWV